MEYIIVHCVCSVSVSFLVLFKEESLTPVFSLEAAASDPESLSQSAIIENLDPAEAVRLDRLRNIGIAVCSAASHVLCSDT